VAHGTRDPRGNEIARRLTELAGQRLGLPAVSAFVELCPPALDEVLAASRTPTVVVPLLLSTGHHVRHDLPGALRAATGPVRLAGPLGPHPLLAAAQADRLRATGAVPGTPVVMVAAGSRDPSAHADLEEAAQLLAHAWGAPVSLATLSGPGRRPADLVTLGHAVSPYLLAPGHFADRARVESDRAGWVAEVLGTHRAVVDLVAERALARAASWVRSFAAAQRKSMSSRSVDEPSETILPVSSVPPCPDRDPDEESVRLGVTRSSAWERKQLAV
jgi:sirohydrochlorin ferrochelatase